MMRSLLSSLILGAALVAQAGAGHAAGVPQVQLVAGLGDSVAQRQDVDEGSKAPPPSGPATPAPNCGPSSPSCP
jgi:hypothetical protein